MRKKARNRKPNGQDDPMKSMMSIAPDGPTGLKLMETATPAPGPGQARIAVKAAGVNFPDVLLTRDMYQFKPQRPFAPGGEVAGAIDAVGAGVTHLKEGDRVLAGGVNGGFATHFICDAQAARKIPDQMPFDEAEKDADARCIILAGAGPKAFCAGGDLREEKDFGDPENARAFRVFGRNTLNRIENGRLPVVAAIHGYCIGGGTALGWVCDIRVAADNSVFRAGDAYLGILPSWGMGLTRLPRYVGRNRALDILLIGENFGAQEAFDMGLVTKVVPRAKLMEEVTGIARRICKASPTAIRATRQAVAANLRESWDGMVRVESELCEMMFAHPDAHEGPAAFAAKREPRFSDQ